jgi:hypothetical protein
VEIMLVAILRPFAQLSKEDFGPFDPEDRCYAHTSSLMSSIWTFRAFCVLKYDYWLVHAISTAAFVAIRGLDHGPAQMDVLIRACQCLHEMASILPLATDCLSTINAAFRKSKVQLPSFVLKYFSAETVHQKDGLMHHARAALMPASESGPASPLYQELLDWLDNLEVD